MRFFLDAYLFFRVQLRPAGSLAGIICKMAGPSVHAFAREGRERGSFTFPLSPPFLAEMKLAGLCRLKA